MKQFLKKHLVPVLGLGLICLVSCEDDDRPPFQPSGNGNGNSNSNFEVRMTDSPGDYSELNLDVEGLVITTESRGSFNVQTTNAGTINLCELTAGKDSLLFQGNYGADVVTSIQLVVGDDNTIVVDGDEFELEKTAEFEQSLIVEVSDTLEASQNSSVLIDFDVATSVKEKGGDEYILDPKIRAYTNISAQGSVDGTITPSGSLAAIIAVNTTTNDSISTFTNEEGKFLLRGMASGTYDLTIDVGVDLLLKTIPGVVVVEGETTAIGSVVLNQ